MPGNVNVDVGGYRGVLENAATESTLAQLLAEAKKHNPALVGAVKQLAQSAGLRAEDIKKFEDAARGAADSTVQLTAKQKIIGAVMQDLTAGTVQTVKNLAALTSNVMDGTLAANNFFRALESLPMGLGKVAALFGALAAMQQKGLDSYRAMSNSGVGFSGDLDKIRRSAADTYLSLDQFTNLMKTNSATFVSMGGTASEGAQQFVKLSKALISGDTGNRLLALGYNTEQINQGLADYIKTIGGANIKTEKDQKALAASASEFMIQMDGLAKLTGQSREQQQKTLDEEMQEASFKAFMATQSAEDQEAIAASMAAASALHGKAGTDIVKASAMGVAVQGDAGKRLTALSGATAESIQKDLALRKSGVATKEQLDANEAKGRKATADNLLSFGGAVGTYGGVFKGVETSVINSANAFQSGARTEEDYRKLREKAIVEAEKQGKSTAARAAQTEQAFKELNQIILSVLLPVVRYLTNELNTVVSAFKKGFFHGLTSLFTSVSFVVPVVAAFVSLITMLKAVAAGGASLPGTGAGGAGSGLKSIAKGALKKAGVLGAILGGGMAYEDITSINEQEKSGKISADEASKQRGGSIGEAGGGLAGGMAGAAMGAMAGSFVPIIGTAIGGLVGGVLGAFGGGYLGKAGGEALMSPKEKRAFGSFGSTGSLFEDFGAKKSVELHGMEAVVTPDQMSKLMQGSAASGIGALAGDIQQLNSMTSQVLRTLMTIADNTKRGVDATKSLNGNLFAR